MSGPADAGGRVLVLDADGQASLSVVRSLARHGVSVTAGSDRRYSLGGLSRRSDASMRYPPVEEDPGAFVDRLVSYLDGNDHFAVVPTNDATSAVLSRHKRRVADTGTLVGVEDWERFERVYDKRRTFELAEGLSIPTPDTFAPDSLSDLERIADGVTYPAVVKSRNKTVWTDGGPLVEHLVEDGDYVDGPDELVDTYRDLLARNEEFRENPPLVQEYVDGRTVTTVGVAEDGELLAYFQELRLRTTPASGGASTLIRGIREPEMAEYAAELLAALEWTGPAQVEFMWTPDGEFYLVEMNGRYWGSTPLAVASGVDVPWLHYCQLAGYTPAMPDAYRDDVVQQRLLYGDLKWLHEQLEEGKLRAFGPFLRALVTADQVFVSTSDPLPTVAALGDAVRLGAVRLGNVRGVGRRSGTDEGDDGRDATTGGSVRSAAGDGRQ
ncbi:carboxylate--amine ligase [Halorarum salinum]|uniref:ATP-grasp domain-containing protein n=1 Tax=Halorarum salinum TaxID=2743089 RepID=A0A7D5LDI1_9EURY|nr:ATP-grasp domain-containing protein [Halobaculum salinum]QLG64313.1 ATP-grasp domain-containing protein [Halobaculum salinum]